MSVIATLVIGSNGATALGGTSTALSTPADRQRFLALHRAAGAYITGRNSYSAESYSNSSAPVLIFSRTTKPVLGATVIDSSKGLPTAMRDAESRFGSPIVVEAGATLFMELLKTGCIQECELSIVPLEGDSHFIDLDVILGYLEIADDDMVDGTRLLKCRYKGSTTYS